MTSLDEILNKVARDVLEDRVKNHMKYTFEKEILPEILDYVTRAVRVELISNANIPAEIILKVKFAKTEIQT